MAAQPAARQRSANARLCAVDIGSNSIKMRLVELADGGRRVLADVRYPVRLGESVFDSGKLSPKALEAAESAFEEIGATIRSFKCDRTRVVATSATREARNREELERVVDRAAALKVDIISGQEEARLLAFGVRPDMAPDTRNLLIDVGGGSAEVVYTRRDLTVESAHSVRLGAVRLTQQLDAADKAGKLSKKEFNLLREEIMVVLESSHLPVIARGTYAIGTAGTISAILTAKHGGNTPGENFFTAEELNALLAAMRDMSHDEIERKLGLDHRRAQIIVPGAMVVAGLMELYDLKRITFSGRGLRDGVLDEMISELLDHEPDAAQEETTWKAALTVGEKYNFDEAHGQHVAKLAARIFDDLREVHQLPDLPARQVLRLAALLHDVGQYISYSRHHKHSYYLLLNDEMPGVVAENQTLVATVARYHRKAAPADRHPEWSCLSEQDKRLVERLAGLVRIADALDRQHRQLVRDVRADIVGDNIIFQVTARGPVELELSAAATKKELFEKVFARGVDFNVEPRSSKAGEETRVGAEAESR